MAQQAELNFDAEAETIIVFAISVQQSASLARQGGRQFRVEEPGDVMEITLGMVKRSFADDSFTPVTHVKCKTWQQTKATTAKLLSKLAAHV